MQNKPGSEKRANTLDTHAPDRPEVRQLSEKEKEQMEAGADAEKEQGPAREKVPQSSKHQSEE